MEIIFHVLVWPLSLCSALLPLITSSYSRIGFSCWINDNTESGTVWMWTLSYALAWIVVFLIAILYIAIIATVIAQRRRRMYQEIHTSRTHTLKLIAYPTAFILMWTLITVYRIYEQVTKVQPRDSKIMFGMEIMQRIALRSQGTLNVIIFMFDSPISRDSLFHILGCCGSKSNLGSVQYESDDESEYESLLSGAVYSSFIEKQRGRAKSR